VHALRRSRPRLTPGWTLCAEGWWPETRLRWSSSMDRRRAEGIPLRQPWCSDCSPSGSSGPSDGAYVPDRLEIENVPEVIRHDLVQLDAPEVVVDLLPAR
jgi:hypothetical protein